MEISNTNINLIHIYAIYRFDNFNFITFNRIYDIFLNQILFSICIY